MLLERSEQVLAIEHSLFESAEYPALQPEASLKRSPHSPPVGSHSGSRSAQPGLLLEMPQSRAQSLSKHFGPLAVAKTPSGVVASRPRTSAILARALMSMQRISFCFAHWIGWRLRAALPRQVLRMA